MSGTAVRIARIATIAAGIAVLGLAAAAWVLSRSGAVDAWLRAALAARLGPEVHAAAARVVWWPHPGVEFDDVSLAEPGAAGDDRARVQTIRCRLYVSGILAGRVAPSAVWIDGAHVALERHAGDTWTAGGLERLVPPTAPAEGGAGAPDALPAIHVGNADLVLRDAVGHSPAVRIDRLRADVRPGRSGATVALAGRVAEGGSIRIRGEVRSLRPPVFVADVNLDRIDAATAAAWLPADAPTATGRLRLAAAISGGDSGAVDVRGSLELSGGEIAGAEWRAAAPLRTSGQAVWTGAALRIEQGRADAAHVVASTLSLQTIAASFAYRGGTLHIGDAALRACGGTWRVSGDVGRGPPMHVDGTLAGYGVDGGALAAALAQLGLTAALPQTESPLRFSANGAGDIGGGWRGHAAIDTDGAVRWPSGRADGPLRIAADVELDDGTVALSAGHAQARRVLLGDRSVDAVAADFSYRAGALRLESLRGGAFGGMWTYTGSVPLGASDNWSGRLEGARVSPASIADVADLGGTVDVRAQLDGRGLDRIAGNATLRVASEALDWRALRIASPAEVAVAGRLADARLTLATGHAHAMRASMGAFAATDLRATFSYADATLAIAAFQAHTGSGVWKAAATIPIERPSRSSGTLDARHVHLDPLLHALGAATDGARTEGAIADLSLHVTPAAGGRVHGSASVRLAAGALVWNELRVDAPAHAHGAFTVRNGAVTLSDGAAEAARAAYGPIVGTRATAAFRYGGDRLTFTDLRFRSCGGAWADRGWFTLSDGGPFAGNLTISGATPGDLAAMLGDQGLNVPFARADVDASFTGRAVPNWLTTLGGAGSARLSDGTVRAAAVLRPIWEAIVGPGRVMNAFNESTTHIDEISETFELRGEHLDTSDFLLIGDDYNATAVGNIGLDGGLNLTARIELTARGVQKMLVLGAVPLPTSALPGLPPIPAFVTGSLGDPVIRPDVGALPASTARWLVDAALHLPRGIGRAIADRLGQLWHGAARAVGLAPADAP